MEEDVLSENDLKAREVTLAKAQYEVIDGVLYHVEQDNTLQIVLPTVDRRKVFDEAHNGVMVLIYGKQRFMDSCLMVAMNANYLVSRM